MAYEIELKGGAVEVVEDAGTYAQEGVLTTFLPESRRAHLCSSRGRSAWPAIAPRTSPGSVGWPTPRNGKSSSTARRCSSSGLVDDQRRRGSCEDEPPSGYSMRGGLVALGFAWPPALSTPSSGTFGRRPSTICRSTSTRRPTTVTTSRPRTSPIRLPS